MPLLLVGLMYREAGRAQECEKGDGKSPEYLFSSPLGLPQMEKLASLINSVVLPS